MGARKELPMVSGTLLLASLLVTSGQVPSDVNCFNHRNLRIPIGIHPSKRAEIKQLVLYVSSDQGKSWQKEAVVPPENDEFLFYAPADGMYWLKVAIVNKQGKQEPEEVGIGPPDQKVLIDTLGPMVVITSAKREGSEVAVGWEIQEEYPDPASLKLEYRPADAPTGPWLSVPVERKLINQARLHPTTSGPLVVRLQMKDLAGNLSYKVADVPGIGGITAASYKASAADNPTPAPAPPPSVIDPPPPVKTPPTPEIKNVVPPHTPDAPPTHESANLPPSVPPAPTAPAATPPPSEPEPKVIARSESPRRSPQPPLVPPAAPAQEGSQATLPVPHLVNNPDVVLNYKLDKVGPSGIGSVELWLTENDGQSWQRWAEYPEVKDLSGGVKYRGSVTLPREGIYGFRMVVKSKAGRGQPAPRPGEAPELRIELDTTPPDVVLLEPRPDPEHKDALLLQWKVRDRNLDAMPITLEYADQRTGPWQSIVSNTYDTPEGYSWKVPQGKVSVYLRLRVRDRAGNEGLAVTEKAQLVDLSEPEGHLIEEVSLAPTSR
jgi:hypothetical protein